MTKEDIIKIIWNQFPDLSYKESRQIYEQTINLIKDTLAKGESVEIRGFGRFSVREKNPRNGQEAVIKERRVVSFKVSRIFKEMVDGDNNHGECPEG